MSSAPAALLLAAVTIGWFVIALIPALRELRDRTDVAPLQLTRGGGDVRHFATTFRRFVDAELPALRASADAPANGMAVELRDGAPAWYVPPGDDARRIATLPVSHESAADLAERVVLSLASFEVPAGTSLMKELYVDGALHGGDDVFYRAALVTGDATLGARSSVLRWIDTGGDLRAGEECTLYGRASALGTIRLGSGVRFQRVAAPCIRFGDGESDRGSALALVEAGEPALDRWHRLDRARLEATRETVSLAMLVPPEHAIVAFGRWLVDGDFVVPAGATVDSDLVVSGTLTIDDGAVVRGAVKSATLIGGAAVIYHGAIIATIRLSLGAGSKVAGPIVVEGEAVIGPGCRVGGAADETTISAVSVRVSGGAMVFGEVWARGWGEVT